MRVLKETFSRLVTHQEFRRYFFNTSWMFAEQLLRIFSGLLVGICVARYLGPNQYGAYSYVVAFVGLFGAVAKLGLDSIVVRDLVNCPEKRDIYLGTAFWLKLGGAFLAIGLLAIALQYTSNDATMIVYAFIVASGLIFQSFDVVDFYFQSKVLSKYVSLCRMVQLALSSILKIYFVYIQADLLWFVMVSLVDQASLALSLVYVYWRQKFSNFIIFFDLNTAKTMLNNSWPLILAAVAVTIYMRIDQIMIKEMLGERAAGLYSAAVGLSEAWYFFPMIITSSLFPDLVTAKKDSEALYMKRLQMLSTFMTWIAIAIAFPVTFIADSVVNMLYGSQYHAAGNILAIHIWGAVFVFLGVSSGVFFTIENYTKKALYRTVLGAGSNVLLNFLLIPRYGINGAAIATVLSQFIANYIYDLFDKSIRTLVIIKTKALLPVCYFLKLK